ncbi:MAG TPA: acetylglutamate kinase [Gaiellaceae bacterium]|nr:acetylglutamate kinase [Gaiellaceae bacterium]
MSLVVVKVGGAASADAAGRVLALGEHHRVCVVHGAGPQITAEVARRGLPLAFVRGRRVTTPEVLAVVLESLAQVNAALVEALGPRAVAAPAGLLDATPVPELGLVGEALPSAPELVRHALDAGLIPVVQPVAAGPLNVNGDEAAVALALGLGADRLVFVTDVPGVLVEGEVARSLAAHEAERLADTFDGGIVPKLLAAVRAARGGVETEIGRTAVTA